MSDLVDPTKATNPSLNRRAFAFFDDTRSSYVASAAADAWTRTLSWFAKHVASR
jgi:dienelactone hydrolase